MEQVNQELVRKYDIPLPRYTSYPTLPHWNNDLTAARWSEIFSERFEKENHINGLSIYVHLPFCESLCTYCGCNKKITTDHSVEEEYLQALEQEWQLYRKRVSQTPIIRELHLGGGTPTFFSARNLKRLVNIFHANSILHPEHEFSFEGHPNNTSPLHLTTLYKAGFRRISLGVQDNDPKVQRLINRHQPFENVKAVTEEARKTGYTSVNFDLIYGLPGQTAQSIENTILEVISLRPDRIAFYSYAHVPWTSRAQRLFDESDLPEAEEKIQLYLTGKHLLMQHGYHDIGMDHFSLETDSLYRARINGSLHRNFMGYTTQSGGMLIGLGVSAISDFGNAYGQNTKTLQHYYRSMDEGSFAIEKGHLMTEMDFAIRKYILDISCMGKTIFRPEHLEYFKENIFPKLEILSEEGLLEYDSKGLRLSVQGHFFIRKIASVFDQYLQELSSEKPVFSKAI